MARTKFLVFEEETWTSSRNTRTCSAFGEKLGVAGGGFKEEGGKIKMWGTAKYSYDKNRLWDKIKTIQGWENEVAADIKIANDDIYGVYTVKSGGHPLQAGQGLPRQRERLHGHLQSQQGPATDPDKIKVGQELKIPHRKA